MKQIDIERFAFFYLCTEEDREMLKGTRKMSFPDFDRLTYLIELLGLEAYNIEIWNRYAGQFEQEIQQIETSCDDGSAGSWQEQAEIQEGWLRDFCNRWEDEDMGRCLKE